MKKENKKKLLIAGIIAFILLAIIRIRAGILIDEAKGNAVPVIAISVILALIILFFLYNYAKKTGRYK